jgi:AraC-like DNA-binding protein
VKPFQLFAESLQVRFLHITRYILRQDWRFPSRTLAHSILWYVEKGSFYITINGREFMDQGERIYLLPAGSQIACRAVSNEIVLTSINFDANITILSGRSWTDLLGLTVRFHKGIEAPVLHFNRMLEHEGQTAPGQPLLQQAELLSILAHLVNQGDSLRSPVGIQSGESMDRRILGIIDYLLYHPKQIPTVSELAEIAGISESYLRKLFFQHTGLSPLHFVHHLKLEQAKKMLAGSDRRVSEIAYGLGFDNPNYFTRLFKKEADCTPLQYRQQFRV